MTENPPFREGYGDGAGRLAARPQRGPGIGARRYRIELDLHGWRRRLEVASIENEEQPARLAPATAITMT